MKLLIIGAEGQVGSFLLRELAAQHQVFGTSWKGVLNLPGLDIRNGRAVSQHLQSIRPEQVVLTAAMTHVDGCEERPQEAQAINVQGTANVVEACRQVQAGLTFFSSDYVFDGQAGPYGEEDAPNPQSVYARSKLAGEHIVAQGIENHLIIRPMFIFSYWPDSMNFFMQVLQQAEQSKPMRVPADQLGHPTHAVNLAQAVAELIESGAQGLYHVAGTTRISKADFARRIMTRLGAAPELVLAVPTAALGQKAPRPLNSGLKTNKVQAQLKKSKLWDLNTALDYALQQKNDESIS